MSEGAAMEPRLSIYVSVWERPYLANLDIHDFNGVNGIFLS